MPQKIILDVDTGTDDAIAVMAAALSPDIDLVGVTTVNGNVPVEYCTENTLRVLDYIGVSVPVHEGHALPLVSTLRPDRRPGFPQYKGSPYHSLHLDLPPARSKAGSRHAVDWLVETLLASDGDIILVPVGPLTNIAAALRKAPEITEKIQEIVIMGGGHEVGNVTPSAEFNIWLDPEAARIVIAAGCPTRLITLDATHQALFSLETCNRLRTMGTPAADATALFSEQRIAAYNRFQPLEEPDTTPIHDALNICAIIDPSVIETVFVHVDIETQGELTDGRTVCDTHHRSGKKPNVHVALKADRRKFESMMMEILGAAGKTQIGNSQELDKWAPFRFFLGDWTGKGSGNPGNSTVERSYALVLSDQFIEIRDRAEYPPQEKNPSGEIHEELGMISFDKSRSSYVLREFHVEGFVNQYVLGTPTAEKDRFVFVTEAIENIPAGWSARTTYEILSENRFRETFDLAGPEKPWACYITIEFSRKTR